MTSWTALAATVWVGIDWATEEHQVCVVDADRNIVEESKIAHSGEDLSALAARLIRWANGDAQRIAVAIERPDGPVVETLLERGIPVYAINPKQLDRFRDRHTVAGAKDDRRDAFVLADSLRTDGELYRRVSPHPPEVVQLREFSRTREEIGEQFIRTTNRIAEQLRRFYPQMLEVGSLNDVWMWELLELAPTPAAAKTVRPARIKALLRTYRVKRMSADEVLAHLRTTPLTVASGVTEAASQHVASLVRQLRVLAAERAQCDRALAEWLQMPSEDTAPEASSGDKARGHRPQVATEPTDVAILLSLPGVGNTIAATLLTEAYAALADRDYPTLRLRTGVAPVTLQTGKQRPRGRHGGVHHAPPPRVQMRRATNARLRDATYHMARVAAQRDPRWKALYAAARARGAKHGAATRTVADRMLKTLVAMLRSRSLYEPKELRTNVHVEEL